ncbi:MAG: YHS domain-containing protein, partial [Cyclobacteriaceae bacterium]
MRKLFMVFSILTFVINLLAQKPLLNLDDKGVEIEGYDPVAYFIVGKPTKGNETIKSSYNNSVYYFSSEENKKLFDADPKKYEVQF